MPLKTARKQNKRSCEEKLICKMSVSFEYEIERRIPKTELQRKGGRLKTRLR